MRPLNGNYKTNIRLLKNLRKLGLNLFQDLFFCSHTSLLFLCSPHRWRCQDFIFPLFISPGTCHLMVEDYSRACQREREVRRKKKKKKAQKKPPHRERDLNPRTLSPEPSVPSVRPQHPAQWQPLNRLTLIGCGSLDPLRSHKKTQLAFFLEPVLLRTAKIAYFNPRQ